MADRVDTGLLDQIGPWSEVKLDIVREYAQKYTTIVNAQTDPSFQSIYIDAFAGAGLHVSKQTGQFVAGSPLNALLVNPPFKEFYFIDLDRRRVWSLAELASDRQNVHVLEGDCNEVLLTHVFPKVRWKDYRRALCLLDPYGLHLRWEVIKAASDLRSTEIFLNFPIADMNRNVLHRDPRATDPAQTARMNSYWGDDSWREVAYRKQPHLFDDDYVEKVRNEDVAEGFRQRLKHIAGFEHVSEPLPMRNSRGATVYYLFFAAHKPVAAKIARAIFGKYNTP
jgi:three-Cys-motif partner protein